MVDTPASGVGGRKAVEVQVLSWAPNRKSLDMNVSRLCCFFGTKINIGVDRRRPKGDENAILKPFQ
jgi:hypothetical protein